jgi:RND superfamily putative drug exporter
MGRILTVVERLERDPDVGAIESFYATGAPHLVSRDRSMTFLVIDLLGDEHKKIETFRRLQPYFASGDLSVRFGGLIPTNVSVFETIQRDLTRAELLVFPLTALVVFLIFGSPASVAVVLAAGGCGIVFAFAALRMIVIFDDVSIFAINTVMLLGIGLAVDYSLFLVNRFREELPARGVDGALVRTMETTGRAVAFSGITVATSLCGLFFFEQMVLRSLGLGGIVVVLGTVVIALTLVPALLAVIGERIDTWRAPFLRFGADADVRTGLWYRTALVVMKRPLMVTILVSALLLSLALPFARFDGTIVDWRVLPAGDPVRITSEILDAEFLPNQSTPHLGLATMPGDVMSRLDLERLAAFSARMANLPGISRVDGVFTLDPGRSDADVVNALLNRERSDATSEARFTAVVKGPWMRFSLLSEWPFDDARSVEQVHALRAMSTPGMRVQVAGYAAALIDLKATIRERTPWMLLVVISAMFIILFFAFGSVTLPVKAMMMSGLSLTASFGAIVWIFQDGRLQLLLDYTPLGFSDITLPLVMFAIVFGLSMDYEVFLLSRIREEYQKSGDPSGSVADGLAATARVITAAAAIMVVVFGAFLFEDARVIKLFGVGLGVAVFIDATIVRMMLVPATMELLGSKNWWVPKWLDRILPHIGFEGREG